MKRLRDSLEYVDLATVGDEDFRTVANADERAELDMISKQTTGARLAQRWCEANNWTLNHYLGGFRWTVSRVKQL